MACYSTETYNVARRACEPFGQLYVAFSILHIIRFDAFRLSFWHPSNVHNILNMIHLCWSHVLCSACRDTIIYTWVGACVCLFSTLWMSLQHLKCTIWWMQHRCPCEITPIHNFAPEMTRPNRKKEVVELGKVLNSKLCTLKQFINQSCDSIKL